jgi:hypothetical protein
VVGGPCCRCTAVGAEVGARAAAGENGRSAGHYRGQERRAFVYDIVCLQIYTWEEELIPLFHWGGERKGGRRRLVDG